MNADISMNMVANRRQNSMVYKKADLSGPGIGNYSDLAKDLPSN